MLFGILLAGLVEADALHAPLSDNAPATPNAVTAPFRPLPPPQSQLASGSLLEGCDRRVYGSIHRSCCVDQTRRSSQLGFLDAAVLRTIERHFVMIRTDAFQRQRLSLRERRALSR